MEYWAGEIFAIAGGTLAHAQLAGNIISILHRLLRDCKELSSDARVRIDASDLSTFPDVSVVCGQLQRSPQDSNALINPTMLVEVTSASTKDYDRGEKLSHYQQLSSLRSVLLIAHDKPEITVISRSGATAAWEESVFRSGQNLSVHTPAICFDVDDVYRDVTLEP